MTVACPPVCLLGGALPEPAVGKHTGTKRGPGGRVAAMNKDDDELRHFLGVNRRKDYATADVVDIGLLYMRVFGNDKGWSFFRGTLIQPEVCWRVMRHRTRGSPPEVDPGRKGDVGSQPP